MARPKSIKTVICETLILFGTVVMVGHMATNYWERFTLDTEVTNMKTSLYTLKDAVNNISNAYDNLYKELQGLSIEDKAKYETDSDKCPKKESAKLETDKLPKKVSSSVDTQLDKEIQSHAVLQAQAEAQARNLIDISTNFEKTVEDFMQQCKAPPVRNTSTLTPGSRPFSSIVLGINGSDKFPTKLSSCIHRRYNYSISDELFYPTL